MRSLRGKRGKVGKCLLLIVYTVTVVLRSKITKGRKGGGQRKSCIFGVFTGSTPCRVPRFWFRDTPLRVGSRFQVLRARHRRADFFLNPRLGSRFRPPCVGSEVPRFQVPRWGREIVEVQGSEVPGSAAGAVRLWEVPRFQGSRFHVSGGNMRGVN